MSPFDNFFWTIDQVIVWVCFKDRALIDTLCDDKGRVAPAQLCETAIAIRIQQAKEAVLEALRSDRLHAKGLRNDNGVHELIPADNWLGMNLFFAVPGVDFEAGPDDSDRPGARWYRLRFERDEVKRLYLTEGTIAGSLPAITANLTGAHIVEANANTVIAPRVVHEVLPTHRATLAETSLSASQPAFSPPKVRAWYVEEYVPAMTASERSPSETDDYEAAQEIFGRVTRDFIRDLRREHAPETWRKAGRRRNPTKRRI
jgi:hypothetical protein